MPMERTLTDPERLAARVRALTPALAAQVATFLDGLAADAPRPSARGRGVEGDGTRRLPTFDATDPAAAWRGALLHGILEHTTALVYVRGVDGRYLLANRRFEEAFHLAPGHAVGKTPAEVLPASLSSAVTANDARVLADGKALEAEELDADGEDLRAFHSLKIPLLDEDGRPYAVCGISSDTSERRREEDRRRRRTDALVTLWKTNLARNRSLAESLEQITALAARTMKVERVGVWLFDATRTKIRCLCLYELSKDRHSSGLELLASEYPAYFRALAATRSVAADRARTDLRTAEFAEDYLSPIGISSMVDAPIRIDGETVGVLCHEHVGPGRHWTDDAQVFAGSLADLTAFAIQTDARVRAERALVESDRRHAATLASLADAVVVVDAGGRVTLVNPAAERLLGRPAARLLGRPLVEVIVPCDEDGAPRPESLDAFLAGGTSAATGGSCCVRRADGVAVPVARRVTPLDTPESEGNGRVVVLHDLSETRRFEEGIRRAQRMEAVGALAGGVAHDFNNLLTVIQGCTQLLLERTPRADPSWELIDEIRRAGDRSGGLARKLLTFARGQDLHPTGVDLNAVLEELRSLLARLVGASIELVLDLGPSLRPVHADAGAIEQVIVNLAANARDAMPAGGRLTLATRNLATLDAGDRVLLTVADTGMGIPPAVLPRIFDPFFTTKAEGKGTGLGLAIVHGIVTQSGGRIDVDTSPGKGTTFRLEFPVHTDAARARPADGGTETVLLAEDDELVRTVARIALVSRGYRLLEARDGVEALALAERHAGDIHLLVSDVNMPRMDGAELATRLLARRPSLCVLLITGFGTDEVLRSMPRSPAIEVLEKPFSPDELGARVRQLLDRSLA